ETQIRLNRQYFDLARTVLTSDVDRVETGRAYLESARRETERYWRDLAGIGTEYAADVLALGSRASKAVLRDVSSTVRTRKGTAAPAGPSSAGVDTTSADGKRLLDVGMSGPIGSTATATVTVANRHDRPRRISLKPGPIQDADGNPVNASIQAKPASVTVQPQAEKAVTLSVELDPEVFATGRTYAGTVDVSGGDEAVLRVHLHVEPAG
ncbi:MAG: hypothetical protein JWO57_4568, partial [Pseudonocardiales bacterium]|nr:hypothetical protein [Pseudonocardiales bacterium]